MEERNRKREGTICAGEERIGIISALPSEISLLLEHAEIAEVRTIGGMDYHVGTLRGRPVVITQSGMGKVLSAAGATAMLNHFRISSVLFTGVAGGVADDTHVLDVVIATGLVQHDYGQMTNQGFARLEGTAGDGVFPCAEELVRAARRAACETVGEEHVFLGTVASGDQFVASEAYVRMLREKYGALACEMEGASVALVCRQYGVPCVVIRTLSDKADGLAHESFGNMLEKAADQSGKIIMKMLEETEIRAEAD